MMNSKAQLAVLWTLSILIAVFLLFYSDISHTSLSLLVNVLFAVALAAGLILLVALGKRKTGWGSERVSTRLSMTLQAGFFLPISAAAFVLSITHHDSHIARNAVILLGMALLGMVAALLYRAPRNKPTASSTESH